MNKEEYIKTLEGEKYKCPSSDMVKGINNGLDKAIRCAEELDEPVKPVLTKEESEWLEKLTEPFDTLDALYYITRCGYGYGFTFEMSGKTYELPLEDGITYGELYELKERLVNAVIYGYEVKKEKRYTVEIPNPNGSGYSKTYLAKNEDGKVELFTWSHYTSIEFADNWKLEENAQLTEEEIKEDNAWAWEANLAKEVKE